MQFRMLDHAGLNEERGSLRIKTDGKPVHRIVDDRLANPLRGVIVGGERMPIDNAVEALEVVLQAHPIVQGTDQMPEV